MIPYYGYRRPKDQDRWYVNSVADFSFSSPLASWSRSRSIDGYVKNFQISPWHLPDLVSVVLWLLPPHVLSAKALGSHLRPV